MKNISRRVFIKGMAVAAVATAASTVLTGCKLPVNTDPTEGEDATPTNVQTVAYTDQVIGKTLTFEVSKVTVYSDLKKIVLATLVKNELDGAVKLNADADGSNKYSINNVACKYIDADGNEVALSSVIDQTTTFASNNLYQKTIDSKDQLSGSIVFNTPTEDWSKMTVTFDVNKYESSASQKVGTVKFVINNI